LTVLRRSTIAALSAGDPTNTSTLPQTGQDWKRALRQRNAGVTKSSMKRVIALLASLTLAGCVSSREVSFQKRASIPAGSAIGVITPPDGVYMEDEYPKSGTVVARKLVAALVPYFPGSGVVTPGMNIEYVLKPQILHWERSCDGMVRET
jgi:hypothetical protein